MRSKKYTIESYEFYYVHETIKASPIHYYVLKLGDNYYGLIESERPNTATYIFSIYEDWITLCRYIQLNDFLNPFINRDYSDEQYNELKDINEYDEDVIDCLIEEFQEENLTPIKYNDFFLAEVKHTTPDEWIKQIETIISAPDKVTPPTKKILK